jgi:N-acetylneuraminic acid mutarotase
MPSLRRVPCLAAVLLLSQAACTSSQPTGSVQFAAAAQALSASDITRVKVTVSASDMSTMSLDLAKSNGSWGGIIGNIPSGSNRSFLAEAYDSSSTKRFQGQTSGVTITANQTSAVAITLQELAPPPAYGNDGPVIDSIVASVTTVQTSGSISLTTTSHDPNAGDTLTYAWTGTAGTFATPTAANSSWTAPSAVGIYTLTFTVTDSQGVAASVSLAVNVVSVASTGSANLTISFNLYPQVTKVTASRIRLDVGQSVSVSATASDTDGDPLTYQWTAPATCPGTWTNATSSTASFVPSAIPSGTCDNCLLTVTVQDGRTGTNKGTINLCVAAATTERFPAQFTNHYQSTTATSPGQTVTFDVTALDPQSSTMTFSWVANIGSLAAAQSTTTTSHVVWTAPSCAVTGVSTTVTAYVANAYGVLASKTFSLTGLPACASGWATTGNMSNTRQYHTATLLLSGKVLVTGGVGGGSSTSSEVYDPATNSWSSAAPMAVARAYHTATLLNSGKVLVTGGYNGGVLNSAEVYDPATNAWSSAGTLASGRHYHTATLLNSGKVLVTGGNGNSGVLNSAEVYDPATNSWSSAGILATGRYYHTATLLNSGKVLVTGGYGNSGLLNSVEVYDPAANSWSAARTMNSARQVHTATVLPSGKVLVSGGAGNGVGNYLSSAEVYDPATNTWATMASASGQLTSTLLPSGKVLVAGGYYYTDYDPDSDSYYPVSSYTTNMYDPGNNTWSTAASMPVNRYLHTATLLLSGRVLITGGLNNGTLLNSGAVYTP